MNQPSRVLALILFLASLTTAQTATEKKATEDREKLEKEAVVFLRETLTDVNGMRSLENRISFASELAGLMWFHDEREARAMYAGLIGDFRDLVAKYDAQMNDLGNAPEEADPLGGGWLVEASDKSRVMRKFRLVVGVRQQIAMTMAEHDADLAFGFFYDSLASISNPELRETIVEMDTYAEFNLLNRLAEANAAKAAKYGVRSLSKGVKYQHIELLKKIYGRDPDKGAEFGAAVLSKLKGDKAERKDLYIFSSLIDFAGEAYDASRKPGGKRPVYDLSELRELTEILAQAILSSSEAEGQSSIGYATMVEKYLPGRAAQIRAKFRSTNTGYASASNSVANAMNSAAYATNIANRAYGSANSNSYGRELEEKEKAERKLLEDVQSLGTKTLSKEERDKIIAQARKIIMQTPGRDKKIMALSMLAAQVSKTGDKELAAEIMRDAERLVNPAPKNYQEFLMSWMLASGYANADPEKAFPILEDTIGRANEILAAFVKVGEFMDANEEMIQDGEVQVGAFGGQMVRGLTGELNMADATIDVLAKADFGKTKALTNHFDRVEIRVLAKMMVLRAILNPKVEKKEEVIDAEPMIDVEN